MSETRHGNGGDEARDTLAGSASCLESVAIGAVEAEQFNGLLWQAQQALPTSQTVCHIERLIESDTILRVLERLQLARVPYIPLLTVKNARQGFFERDEFLAVVKHLEAPLDDIAWLGYLTGARKGEITSLRWEHVDRGAGVITLVETKKVVHGQFTDSATRNRAERP